MIFMKFVAKVQCLIYGHDWKNIGLDWPTCNKLIPKNVSIRHLLECMHCNKTSFEDHYINEVKCIICNMYVEDLQKHCKEFKDKEHLILLVHES